MKKPIKHTDEQTIEILIFEAETRYVNARELVKSLKRIKRLYKEAKTL